MAKKKKNSRKSGAGAKSYNTTPSSVSVVREAYRFMQKQVETRTFRGSTVKAGLDLDPVRVQRRVKATESCAKQVERRVLQQFPDMEDFFVTEDWAQANSQPMPAYDAEEEMNTFSMGIAIWILDQLRDCDKLSHAMEWISADSQRLDNICAPAVWDPCHSEDMIFGMMDVIQSRNCDCVPNNRIKSSREEPTPQRIFMDLFTAENIHRQEVPSRERFEKILALIPEPSKEDAASAFTEKFWDWLDRYYYSRRIYALEEKQLDEDFRALREKEEKLVSTLEEGRQQGKRTPIDQIPMPTDFRGLPPIPLTNPLFRTHAESLRIAKELDDQQDALEKRSELLEDKVSDLWFFLRTQNGRTYEESVNTYGKEMADIWKDFAIEDPYKLSFGYLYLLDSGSDLPWLYFPGVNLFLWIAGSFPWARWKYEFEDDPVWSQGAGDAANTAQTALPKRIKQPDLENWYAMDYVPNDVASEFQERYNLAQIIYEITGGIMPRKPERYLTMLEELDYYGITGKKALHPLLYCMSILGEARHQSRHYCVSDNIPGVDDRDTKDTAEELQAVISALRKENEQLRGSLHHTSRELRDTKKKQEAANMKASLERQELADLRELVFHQQEGVYQDDVPDKNITFPCHTTRRIVVFGGHDSWAREIKPKLPDVRFVDRTVLPNANMIRNAEVVWVQTNALSHAYYYKIIEEVRKHNIPVRYFSYASAVKCAEQIVEMDRT